MHTFHTFQPRYDAVIVGARCAGAATARLLASSGAKVLVIDRQTYGADTLSTHALMRGAVVQLSRWGIIPEIVTAGTPAIQSTTFHYGDESSPKFPGLKRERVADFVGSAVGSVIEASFSDPRM